jgi:hypothetical protein
MTHRRHSAPCRATVLLHTLNAASAPYRRAKKYAASPRVPKRLFRVNRLRVIRAARKARNLPPASRFRPIEDGHRGQGMVRRPIGGAESERRATAPANGLRNRCARSRNSNKIMCLASRQRSLLPRLLPDRPRGRRPGGIAHTCAPAADAIGITDTIGRETARAQREAAIARASYPFCRDPPFFGSACEQRISLSRCQVTARPLGW